MTTQTPCPVSPSAWIAIDAGLLKDCCLSGRFQISPRALAALGDKPNAMKDLLAWFMNPGEVKTGQTYAISDTVQAYFGFDSSLPNATAFYVQIDLIGKPDGALIFDPLKTLVVSQDENMKERYQLVDLSSAKATMLVFSGHCLDLGKYYGAYGFLAETDFLYAPVLFETGSVVVTPGANGLLRDTEFSPEHFVIRHQCGDWSQLCAEDAQANHNALLPKREARVFSKYQLDPADPDSCLYVITEWDRSYTTVMLPEEY